MSEGGDANDLNESPVAPEQAEADQDRAAILARRNRFVAAALAGLAGASLVAACGGETSAGDAGTGDAAVEAAPQACLSPIQERDANPQPCLGAPFEDAATRDAAPNDGGDASPQPCLSAPPPDAGDASDQ